MYFYQEVAEQMFRLGVNDRRISRFENMFPMPEGVCYNSYLLMGEKNLLMDTVDACFMDQFLENLEAALQGKALDYIVISHMEPDHSTAIEAVMRAHPECKLVGNAKSFQFMEQFYGEQPKERWIEVKDGDTLDIGNRTLQFIFAPMVHWPEVMMTMTDRGELFTADAFGSFGAIAGHIFSDTMELDEAFMNEARRYYINIVGKHGKNVTALLKKLEGKDIQMILPLHGPIHRTQENIQKMVEKYRVWASFEPEEKGVLIALASMYGNSALAMDMLAYYLVEEGVKNVKIYDVSGTDYSYITAAAHRYSHLVITPLTYNMELYPKMDAFLRDLVGTGYKNRTYSLVGNASWGGKAVKMAEEILAPAKCEKIGEDLMLKSAATQENLEELRNLAKEIAASLK
ncbi:MAG: FprA family A-type flavoprotein [Tissierellia bacterium]|nr:FprA family A-type flavoprotein [Tissierellia bacterium]